jgi:adenosyl cobinamide kinase/adenosyl cobinamide phosphate guanylyltransferase
MNSNLSCIVPNVELVVGLRESGKSLWAEERLAAVTNGRLFYGATLASIYAHRARIRRHAERRGARWQVVEIERGVGEISSVLRSAHGTEGVLLDGLSALLLRRFAAADFWRESLSSEWHALEGEFRTFLEGFKGSRPRLLIVTTVVRMHGNYSGLTTAERAAVGLHAKLLKAWSGDGIGLWHANEGHVREATWNEIASSYGLTTDLRATREPCMGGY